MKKLKGNTASQKAQHHDHVLDTRAHWVTPSNFDERSMGLNNGERWERSGFDGEVGRRRLVLGFATRLVPEDQLCPGRVSPLFCLFYTLCKIQTPVN